MAQEPLSSTCAVLPRPVHAEASAGAYLLSETTTIHAASTELEEIGRYLAELVAPATGLQLTVKPSMFSTGIALELDNSRMELGEKGYSRVCTPKGVVITGAKPAGVFYGVQTLRQLLPVQIESPSRVQGVEWKVPSISTEDRPV